MMGEKLQMADVEKNVEITVYGTHWCGDCVRSETLLKSRNIPYRWIDIDKDDVARAYVIEVNGGYASVPTIIFADGEILVEPSNRELVKKLESVADTLAEPQSAEVVE
jgi:glutaredoxin-like protein